MLALEVGQKSHVGRSRKINQDSFAVLDSAQLGSVVDGLFVVADGMGGRAGGEIASQVTVQTVCNVVREFVAETPADAGNGFLSRVIGEAVSAANQAVWNQSRANPELRGMGTTCVAALIHENVAAVCNVGDSRIYLLRRGEMVQLTSDHSLVHEYVLAGDLSPEQARSSRYKNVITRAVGIANEVNPDVELVDLTDGDTLLLCSDGLTNMLSDTDIARVLSGATTSDRACEDLVDAANANGGIDNITAVVIRCGRFVPSQYAVSELREAVEEDRAPVTQLKRGLHPIATAFIAILVLILGTAGLIYFINGSFPVVSIKWKPDQFKPPLQPAAPKRVDYDPPQFVTTKPLLGSFLACDGSGTLIVRSTAGKLIRMSSTGEIKGTYGPALPTLDSQSGVHVKTDAGGNLYVSLKREKVIRKYDLSGKRIAEIGAKSLSDPEDIAIDPAGNVYVVDGGRLKVCTVHEATEESGKPVPPKASEQTPHRPGESDGT